MHLTYLNALYRGLYQHINEQGGEQDKPHNGHAKCSTPARVSNEIRQTGPYVEKENTRIN